MIDEVKKETLDFIIFWETGGDPKGGLVNHSLDPGGLTKWGISQRAYPSLDISNLTRADAEAIYDRDYYQAVGAPGVPPAMAFLAAQSAVNAGVMRVRKWVLGATKGGWREVAAQLLWHYMKLDSLDDTFGLGWARRTTAAILKAKEIEERYGGQALK